MPGQTHRRLDSLNTLPYVSIDQKKGTLSHRCVSRLRAGSQFSLCNRIKYKSVNTEFDSSVSVSREYDEIILHSSLGSYLESLFWALIKMFRAKNRCTPSADKTNPFLTPQHFYHTKFNS